MEFVYGFNAIWLFLILLIVFYLISKWVLESYIYLVGVRKFVAFLVAVIISFLGVLEHDKVLMEEVSLSEVQQTYKVSDDSVRLFVEKKKPNVSFWEKVGLFGYGVRGNNGKVMRFYDKLELLKTVRGDQITFGKRVFYTRLPYTRVSVEEYNRFLERED